MSTTVGYFDETILNNIRATAAALGLDDRILKQYIPNYDVIKAIERVQTAKLGKAFSPKKENDVEIIWENTCGVAVEDNTTCEIGGTKSSTNIQEYSLSYEKVVNFSADEADFIDNEFSVESSIAKLLLKADVELTNHFAQYCVGRLNTFRGQNRLTTGKGVVAGVDTTIDSALWDSTIMAYMNRVGIINKFTSPVIITGNNLYESIWVANANKGNADGKGEPVMWGSMPIFFDLFNVDTVNDPTLRTYMLSQHSVALAHRAYNPSMEVVNGVFSRWTMKSKFLPFTFDVFYRPECTTKDLIKHNFKVKLTADLFNNPIGCIELDSGVLTFDCE